MTHVQEVFLLLMLSAVQNPSGADEDLFVGAAKTLFCHICSLVPKSLCGSATHQPAINGVHTAVTHPRPIVTTPHIAGSGSVRFIHEE